MAGRLILPTGPPPTEESGTVPKRAKLAILKLTFQDTEQTRLDRNRGWTPRVGSLHVTHTPKGPPHAQDTLHHLDRQRRRRIDLHLWRCHPPSRGRRL